MWYIYIVQWENGKFYCGPTNNLDRRFKEHQKNGSHFTSYNHAIKLLYSEEFDSKYIAAKREQQIKGWTRRKKLVLINGELQLLKKL